MLYDTILHSKPKVTTIANFEAFDEELKEVLRLAQRFVISKDVLTATHHVVHTKPSSILTALHMLKLSAARCRAAAAAGMTEQEMRMHWCRGHFKIRKTGVFWWSPHVRGHRAPFVASASLRGVEASRCLIAPTPQPPAVVGGGFGAGA